MTWYPLISMLCKYSTVHFMYGFVGHFVSLDETAIFVVHIWSGTWAFPMDNITSFLKYSQICLKKLVKRPKTVTCSYRWSLSTELQWEMFFFGSLKLRLLSTEYHFISMYWSDVSLLYTERECLAPYWNDTMLL